MNRKRDEFRKNFAGLNKHSQKKAIKYLEMLIACEQSKPPIPPPTIEQLQRVPHWLIWKIAATLFIYTWQYRLAEIGLKIGGL
jgi:hypothetical protein